MNQSLPSFSSKTAHLDHVDPADLLGETVEIHKSMGTIAKGMIGIVVGQRDGACLVALNDTGNDASTAMLIPAHKLSIVVYRQKRIRTRYKILHGVIHYGTCFAIGMGFGILFSSFFGGGS